MPGRHLISLQGVAMTAVVAVAAVFVLYPLYFLLDASLDVGDPEVRPPTAYGFDNFAALFDYRTIMVNTLTVAFASTVMALAFGFLIAWILNRTNVPFSRTLDQLMAVPYYVTPLLGALAWSFLGAPESGFINEVWHRLGGEAPLIDITSPLGIAWVMALFEGSVAFVMIGAVLRSMDPSLEEASQVTGAGRRRTLLRVTLPLAAPGVLGAAIFVFAEMLGSFSAALVLGTPARFFVITTAIYQLVSQFPPRLPMAAAMGVSLFAVMFLMMFIYRSITARRSFVTISGKAFRPRRIELGATRWALFAVCAGYVLLAAVLPLVVLAYVSVQKLAVAFPAAANFTLNNFVQALSLNAVTQAMTNSLALGFLTATIGVGVTGLLAWIIERSSLPGRRLLEHVVMLPQAVPRLVFAFGMMWAWLVLPVPVYGTFLVLLIAYLTVFLPLGVRTISAVIMQLDPSLDECGQVCGATWGHRIRTIVAPLLRPGLVAAWLLIFIASVRELGASILLMGPNSKVLTPAIVESWFSASAELTAAMALIQTAVIGMVMVVLARVTRRTAFATED
ncbi:MAG: iron ABC transporter permease [Bradyrhizobiaceae bacterium]|nr:iron ABC transporter permease [Bradyrhizobiaceae bacterium]